MSINQQFMTRKKFSSRVEKVVREKSLSYMDGILHLCEEENIDPEEVSKFVSPVIKGKLEAEAKRLNFLPKGNELSFE